MKEAMPNPHFPTDIELKRSPLAEAWLEIRWKLEPVGHPQIMRDPGFPFALGAFYREVKERFSYQEPLPASQTPLEMLPHVVRYRFRPGEGQWPLLQLGPGVASVNFTETYTWEQFREDALYLRSVLSEAYSDSELDTDVLILRYRNVEPFEYSSNDLLQFMKENLNTSFNPPSHIPGFAGSKNMPTSANIVLAYDLNQPKGTGTLRITTGTSTQSDPETGQQQEVEVLVTQLEVASGGDDAPRIADPDEFSQWLDATHGVAHEWFFSLIEGALFEEYAG